MPTKRIDNIMSERNTIAMTTDQATEIVDGFLHLVRGRSAVRLDFRDYGDRDAYLHDRNMIRRQTLAFDKAWRDIAWRNKHDLACALIVACKPSRIEWNAEKKTWSYCVGLYQPTEIRCAGESVVKHAKRILG